jgi:hypothetical protein
MLLKNTAWLNRDKSMNLFCNKHSMLSECKYKLPVYKFRATEKGRNKGEEKICLPPKVNKAICIFCTLLPFMNF